MEEAKKDVFFGGGGGGGGGKESERRKLKQIPMGKTTICIEVPGCRRPLVRLASWSYFLKNCYKSNEWPSNCLSTARRNHLKNSGAESAEL